MVRDMFGKELKKIQKARSGDEAPLNYETYTTWPHFKSMLFLKNQMKPRKSGGNLQPNINASFQPDESERQSVCEKNQFV